MVVSCSFEDLKTRVGVMCRGADLRRDKEMDIGGKLLLCELYNKWFVNKCVQACWVERGGAQIRRKPTNQPVVKESRSWP